MLRPGRLVSAFMLLAFFVVIAVGGSAPVSDRGVPGSAMPRGREATPGAVRVPKAPETPMPTGGTVLAPASSCPTSRTALDASQLQTGIQALSTPVWRSADGGLSAPLPDGRVLWFFGDTTKSPDVRPKTMLGNSMLMSTGSCFTQYLPPDKGALIPDGDSPVGKVATWPTAVIDVDHGTWTEVLLFGNHIHRTGGYWGFTLLGTTLTRLAVPRGGAPRILSTTALTADTASAGHITWGTAAVLIDGWVYLYGTRVVAGSLGRDVLLARARLEDVQDASRWTYEGPSGWGDLLHAAPVSGLVPGTSHIISVFPRGAAWYVVSKVGGDFGDDVGVWKSSTPAGPFRLVERVRRPFRGSGNQVRYMPLAHPEFTTGSTVVASMSRNVIGGDAIARDHALGRPEFFTLALP